MRIRYSTDPVMVEIKCIPYRTNDMHALEDTNLQIL